MDAKDFAAERWRNREHAEVSSPAQVPFAGGSPLTNLRCYSTRDTVGTLSSFAYDFAARIQHYGRIEKASGRQYESNVGLQRWF